MSDVKAPTCSELYNALDCKGDIDEVHREADDSWRHGSYVYQVFHRKSDDTYWAASYNLQTDGEYHGLRDGDADISRVTRVEETKVVVNYAAYEDK